MFITWLRFALHAYKEGPFSDFDKHGSCQDLPS